MKVGFVTDTHLGLGSDENLSLTLDSYESILSEFKKRNVETVIHLGDCIDERTSQNLEELHDRIVRPLHEFENSHTISGNHDANGIDEARLPSDSQVMYENGDYLLQSVSTAFSAYENVGYISENSLEDIENALANGKKMTLVSHYPLAYTEARSDVFDAIPERAFPVNKIDLVEMQEENPGTIEQIVCGHLHPPRTTTTSSPLLGSKQTVIEPVTEFSVESGEVVNTVNTAPDIDSMIMEF